MEGMATGTTTTTEDIMGMIITEVITDMTITEAITEGMEITATEVMEATATEVMVAMEVTDIIDSWSIKAFISHIMHLSTKDLFLIDPFM